jgi:hypothetical protein
MGQTSFQFLLQFLYPGSVLSTQSTAKEIAKCGTVRLLVRTLVTRIRGLRISLNGTYQSCLKSVPVEEQPVARTTITPSMAVSNTDRLISLEKAPEQWSVRKLPLLE